MGKAPYFYPENLETQSQSCSPQGISLYSHPHTQPSGRGVPSGRDKKQELSSGVPGQATKDTSASGQGQEQNCSLSGTPNSGFCVLSSCSHLWD